MPGRYFAILSLLFVACHARQQGIVVQMRTFDDSLHYSMEFLCRLEKAKDSNTGAKRLMLPPAFQNKPVAYGLYYFHGAPKVKGKRNSLVFVVADYEKDTCQFIIDANANEDHRDDSVLQVICKQPFEIRLRNHFVKNASQRITMKYVNDRKPVNELQEKSLQTYYDLVMRNAVNKLPPSFLLYTQPHSRRIGYLPDGQMVSLVDWDKNGVFSDARDRVMAGDVRKDTFNSLQDNHIRTRFARDRSFLPFGNKTYQLLGVDTHGEWVRLLQVPVRIDTLEQLKAFYFKDSGGKSARFRVSSKHHYSVLYFWGSWCIGCRVQSPMVVNMMQAYPSVQFIPMNFGDTDLEKYITEKGLPFARNRITNKTVQDLQLDGFPYFIVVDKNNKVMLRTNYAPLVERWLKEKAGG